MIEIKHRFYDKTKKEQQKLSMLFVLSALAVVLFFTAISWIFGVWFIAGLMVVVTLTILAPFLDVPRMVSSGKLIYLSPLFFAEREKKKIINVHSGTLFDYLFVLEKNASGRERTQTILLCFIRGLLELIERTEDHSKDDVMVRGTSYFLGEDTARKIGFTSVRTDLTQTFILLFNYVNLTVAYSYARANLTFPRMSRIKTFEAKISDLKREKPLLLSLEEKLSRE